MEQLQEALDNLRNADIVKMYYNFKSSVYQPDKVSINSRDDNSEIVYSTNAIGFFNTFRINFKTPFLNVKSICLLKSTIPIITTNIPDTELTFWYYRLPINSPYQEPVPPESEYLQSIRINPSYYSRDLVPPQYPINRYYNTYQDLLYDLSQACVNDFNNPYFRSGDISFYFDASSNKFSFNGNNVYDGSGNLQYFYIYAGYDDPNVLDASEILKQYTTNNFGIQGMPGQPYSKGRTLNIRLGMTWSGEQLDIIPYKNRLRPVPDYNPQTLLGLSFNTPTYTAESYACLVYSQNVNVYCNIASSSSYSSENGGTPNFLMSVPLNTSSLGVAYYNNTQKYPLYKIPKEIYSIEFTLKTDTNDEFNFPDSENINLEIGFEYY